jgi:cytochrome c553
MPVTNNLIATLMIIVPAFAAAETATFVSMPEEMSLAVELDADIERGKKQFALCATCHFENGLGKADGSFPSIAGQHKSVVIKQMADFRANNRDNPTMVPFSDVETIGGAQALADVAAYIASLPANSEPGQGSGENLETGAALFKEHCVLCHADDATGSADFAFPRLQSQHYAYLKRQMQWIRDGHRRNPNPEMKRRLSLMDDVQIDAIADYISRIKLD